MKIIFLDVDGVINTDKNFERLVKENNGVETYSMYVTFDTDTMNNLKDLIEKTNAYIVISSSWRKTMKSNILARWDILMEGLESINVKDRLLGVIPTLVDDKRNELPRGQEIKKWLEGNKDKNIEKFVILDDYDDKQTNFVYLLTFKDISEFVDNLVLCDSYDGFSIDKMDKALKILL